MIAVDQKSELIERARRERTAGRPSEALHALVPLLDVAADDPEVWLEIGAATLAMGSLPQAGDAYHRVLELEPDHRGGLIGAGLVLQRRGLNDDACVIWEHAATVHDSDPVLPTLIGEDHLRRGCLDAAADWFRDALARRPEHPDALAGLGATCEHAGRADEGAALLAGASRQTRSHGGVAAVYARCLLRTGDAEAALAAVETGLAADRDPTRRVQLEHVHGDVLERLGRHVDAFAAIERANAARTVPFDGRRHLAAVRHLMTICSAERLRDLPRGRDTRRRPLLIVGMPRSGTSLIEQMLASHPDVAGAGELDFWRLQVVALAQRWSLEDGDVWYRHLDRLTPELLTDLGAAYLEELDRIAPDAALVTDKMPQNIFQLPLVSLALPAAVVVHAVRDPLDTAWSCYRQNFSDGLRWSTSLENIGLYLRAEREVMAHWKRTLPGPILTVRYEDLTSDPRAALEPVLRAAGLEWDDAMLEFHRIDRQVATASYDQVRRPLYRSSVGRSEPYRRQLAPLAEMLAAFGPMPGD